MSCLIEWDVIEWGAKVSERIFSLFLLSLQIGAYIMLNCMKTRPNDCKCKYYSKHFKTYNNPNNRKGPDPSTTFKIEGRARETKSKSNKNCFRTMILCFYFHSFGLPSIPEHDEVAFSFCALNAEQHSKLSLAFHQHSH